MKFRLASSSTNPAKQKAMSGRSISENPKTYLWCASCGDRMIRTTLAQHYIVRHKKLSTGFIENKQKKC